MCILPTIALLAACAAATAADQGSSAGGAAPEHTDALQKAPDAVRSTLLRKAEKTSSRITEVERKDKNGTVFYDCELENEDVEFELKILEDGRIVEVDHESVDWEDLPAKVRDGILAASGDASITCVKRTRHADRPVFKADTVNEQGEGRMVLVDPEGARVER